MPKTRAHVNVSSTCVCATSNNGSLCNADEVNILFNSSKAALIYNQTEGDAVSACFDGRMAPAFS